MDTSSRKEILNQANALSELAGGDDKLVVKLIEYFGEDFRRIINEYEEEFGSVPTPDQVIWISGVHMDEDPRTIAERLKKAMME